MLESGSSGFYEGVQGSLLKDLGLGPRGLSKSLISRVIVGFFSIWGTYNSTYNLLTNSPRPLS